MVSGGVSTYVTMAPKPTHGILGGVLLLECARLVIVAKDSDTAGKCQRALQRRSRDRTRTHAHAPAAITKFYIALSAGCKPTKKQGTVRGDLVRARRGAWKLTRTMDDPSMTAFTSQPYQYRGSSSDTLVAGTEKGNESLPPIMHLRAFLLQPITGRTHQLRVVLKSLGSGILGDPLYSSSSTASSGALAVAPDRTYLHACGLMLRTTELGIAGDYGEGDGIVGTGGVDDHGVLRVVNRPRDGVLWDQQSNFGEAWEAVEAEMLKKMGGGGMGA